MNYMVALLYTLQSLQVKSINCLFKKICLILNVLDMTLRGVEKRVAIIWFMALWSLHWLKDGE